MFTAAWGECTLSCCRRLFVTFISTQWFYSSGCFNLASNVSNRFQSNKYKARTEPAMPSYPITEPSTPLLPLLQVGDSISAFAEVNPADRGITLSHLNPLDADDMLAINEDEGEVEEVEDEAALLLERLEAEGFAGDAEPAEVDADAEVSALDSRTLTAGLYYEQSRTYSTSAAQSFLDGKTPLAFPQRPMVGGGGGSCYGGWGFETFECWEQLELFVL